MANGSPNVSAIQTTGLSWPLAWIAPPDVRVQFKYSLPFSIVYNDTLALFPNIKTLFLKN